ncbi:MAG: hypothetical protein OEY28_09670, partial [Nitrospira sp.]|nr:hypothetical protein [Nitrospira sp.]
SPRSWHMLSDVLASHGDSLSDEDLEIAAYGCLSPAHAGQFKAFVKQLKSKYRLTAILKGESGWPTEPEDRDVLYFLTQSFRAQLLKDLPRDRTGIGESHKAIIHKAKALIKSLASISLEMAQMVAASPGDVETLPDWFLTEIVRDLPRLVEARDGTEKTKS